MTKVLFLILIFLTGISPAYSQSKADTTDFNNWKFRISPYFWFVGFKGTIYKPPQPANLPNSEESIEIDVSFRDIQNHLKFALMIAGEYRGEKLTFQFNSSSLILESEFITPKEILLSGIVVRISYSSGDASIGYRIIKSEKIDFDGVMGLKFVYFKVIAGANILNIKDIEGERNWFLADPVFGYKFRYRPAKKIEVMSYGDVGFILGDELTYQFFGGITYKFTKTFHTSIIYRYWFLDVPVDEAIYVGTIKGWMIRLGFQF